MVDDDKKFLESDFVKARLFREPVYRSDDMVFWLTLRNNLDHLRRYFHQVGQELILDEAEGYAFIRQIEPEGEEKVPRLSYPRPLNYETTLLLVFLREELDRFETSGADSTRLVRSRDQLRALVSPYLRDSTDKARDRQRVDEAIKRLVTLGFLRAQASSDVEEFEVMRIVKARFGARELEDVRERVLRYAQPDR